jgi:preprotein translocase subunit SecA
VFEGFQQHFHVELPDEVADYGDREALAADLYERGEAAYKEREEKTGLELILRIFRHLYLEELDKTWVEHLTDMDHLRDGIGLRGYGQKDPKQEYKKEGYNMFVTMLARVSSNVVTKVMTVQVRAAEEEQLEAADLDRHMKDLANAIARHGGEVVPASPSSPGLSVEPEEPPVGAEMVCPCGSGKKFMKCHGADMGVEDRTV